jgi:hypothetical protein
LTFGDRGFDLLGEGADFVTIIGAERHMQEAEAIGDQAGNGEIGQKTVGGLKALTRCEVGP